MLAEDSLPCDCSTSAADDCVMPQYLVMVPSYPSRDLWQLSQILETLSFVQTAEVCGEEQPYLRVELVDEAGIDSAKVMCTLLGLKILQVRDARILVVDVDD
jgi:hypothetical protein